MSRNVSDTPQFPALLVLWKGRRFVSHASPSGLEIAQAAPRCLPYRPGHPTPGALLLPGRRERNSIPSCDFLLNTARAPELEQPSSSNTQRRQSTPRARSASGPSRALCQGHPAVSQLTHPPWLPTADRAKFKLTLEFRDSRTFMGQPLLLAHSLSLSCPHP